MYTIKYISIDCGRHRRGNADTIDRQSVLYSHPHERLEGISSGATHFSVRARPFASVFLVENDRASVCVGGGSSGTTHFF
jgi:hypothetical protein